MKIGAQVLLDPITRDKCSRISPWNNRSSNARSQNSFLGTDLNNVMILNWLEGELLDEVVQKDEECHLLLCKIPGTQTRWLAAGQGFFYR